MGLGVKIPTGEAVSLDCPAVEIPHPAPWLLPLEGELNAGVYQTLNDNQHSHPRCQQSTMDLHRTSILNQMDYSGEGRDAKEGKVQSTEERLDSGLDSLKEEEYVVVTEELQQLRLECPPQQQRQECSNEPWKTQVSEDGDT